MSAARKLNVPGNASKPSDPSKAILEQFRRLKRAERLAAFEDLCNTFCISCAIKLDDEGLCPDGCDDEDEEDFDDEDEDAGDGNDADAKD
jgi:hypothetical protein